MDKPFLRKLVFTNLNNCRDSIVVGANTIFYLEVVVVVGLAL